MDWHKGGCLLNVHIFSQCMGKILNKDINIYYQGVENNPRPTHKTRIHPIVGDYGASSAMTESLKQSVTRSGFFSKSH